MRQKILDLFSTIKELEKFSEESARKSHHAANEVSGGLVASYSAAGDVEHARNSANLSMQKYESIRRLSKELENSLQVGTPELAVPVCFVKIKFANGTDKEIYLVKNPVFVSGFNLISPESLLGKELTNKKPGDSLSYLSDGQKFEGVVIRIE